MSNIDKQMKKTLAIIVLFISIPLRGQNRVYERLSEQYSSVYPSGDFYIVSNNSAVGVYSSSGEIIIPVEYSTVLHQSKENFFIVAKNTVEKNYQHKGGQWGILGLDGKEILPLKYTRIYGFGTWNPNYQAVNIGGHEPDNSGGIYIGGKNGIIDNRGKIKVKCLYDYASPYLEDGLFSVNIGGHWEERSGGGSKFSGGKWGCVDENGNIVVPIEYDESVRFKDGVARVEKDGISQLIKNPLKDPSSIQIKLRKNSLAASHSAIYPEPNSDVDSNIPINKLKNENSFAFIIANELYDGAPVPYAINDGRIFKEYCIKVLGVLDNNVHLYENATYGTMISAVEDVKKIARAYGKDATIVLYYAGHGFPSEKDKGAFLLPIDGDPSIEKTCISLAQLYDDIGQIDTKQTLILLDACFSGAKREGEMLQSSRGVAIKTKPFDPKGNTVVFSASQGDETAHQFEEKRHGLFTYFLLKSLQESKGNISLADLSEYVIKQVKRQSVVVNNKKQTPSISVSMDYSGDWKTMKVL